MRAVQITTLLDERISELARNKLPEQPGYPAGDAQYASFMMSLDERNGNGDKDRELSKSDVRGMNRLWNDDPRGRIDTERNGSSKRCDITLGVNC